MTPIAVLALAGALIMATPAAPVAATDPLQATAGSAAPAKDAPPATDYCGRDLGRWFYCERPDPPDAAPTPDPDAATPSPRGSASEEAALAAAQAYGQRLEALGKIASWNPTPQNVEAYIRYQRIGLDKASVFSDRYQRLVWTTPDLNYEARRPMMQAAKADFDDTRKADRDVFLRKVSADIGVYYVFAGRCAACRTASPIYRHFADRFGVNVRPISTDGATNPYFPKTLQNNGQLEAWGVDPKVTPALLLYQSFTPPGPDGQAAPIPVVSIEGRRYSLQPCAAPRGCVTYLASGVISVEDAADRIFSLLAKEPGTEF